MASQVRYDLLPGSDMSIGVETLNNLCERKMGNICTVSYRNRRCCFISTRNHALDCLFFITSIMMLTELLQTKSLRKCVLCE